MHYSFLPYLWCRLWTFPLDIASTASARPPSEARRWSVACAAAAQNAADCLSLVANTVHSSASFCNLKTPACAKWLICKPDAWHATCNKHHGFAPLSSRPNAPQVASREWLSVARPFPHPLFQPDGKGTPHPISTAFGQFRFQPELSQHYSS